MRTDDATVVVDMDEQLRGEDFVAALRRRTRIQWLARRIGDLTGQSNDEVLITVLEAHLARISGPTTPGERATHARTYLEAHVWPSLKREWLGAPLTRAQERDILEAIIEAVTSADAVRLPAPALAAARMIVAARMDPIGILALHNLVRELRLSVVPFGDMHCGPAQELFEQSRSLPPEQRPTFERLLSEAVARQCGTALLTSARGR